MVLRSFFFFFLGSQFRWMFTVYCGTSLKLEWTKIEHMRAPLESVIINQTEIYHMCIVYCILYSSFWKSYHLFLQFIVHPSSNYPYSPPLHQPQDQGSSAPQSSSHYQHDQPKQQSLHHTPSIPVPVSSHDPIWVPW